MKIVTAKQMKDLENNVTLHLGLPSIIMMENAALRTAAICLEDLKDIRNPKVVIIAGNGCNGGDGLALARHLYTAGVHVGVIIVGEVTENGECNLPKDAETNLKIVKNLGIEVLYLNESDNFFTDIPYSIETCDMVIDALLGTGMNRALSGSLEYLVDVVNCCAKRVVALDVPSGIDCDTGKVMGIAVKAHKTITYGLPKIGLYLYPAVDYVGELQVVDICIPESLIFQQEIMTSVLTGAEARELLPKRATRAYKGTFGKTMALSGSTELPGAARLVCMAAYHGGAGLVRACVSRYVAQMIQQSCTEVVASILPDEEGFLCKRSYEHIAEELSSAAVILVGPGLGLNQHTKELVYELIANAQPRIVIDADALNAVAEDVDILKKLKSPAVITPHPGEMSRLTGLSTQEILDNTVEITSEFAKKYNVVTVLKDARTVIASPSGRIFINTTGNAAMAKAGSGDVLTGLIGAFISQGLEAFNAAILACYIHGRAGQLASEKLGMYGVIATDLLEFIRIAIKNLG